MSFGTENSLQAATIDWIDRFAPFGVVATDRELRIRAWNQWMKDHSGLGEESVLGRALTEVYPDLIPRRLEGHFHRALKGEISILSTALHGHLFALEPAARNTEFARMRQTARIAPLMAEGEVRGVIVVIEDVTQREWQAEVLRRQHARDEILSWALAHLLKSDDPRRASRELFYKVASHLDFDAFLLFLFDEETSSFRLTSAGGLNEEAEDAIRVIRADQIPWLGSAERSKPLIRERVQTGTDPILAIGKFLGFHAYVTMPLIATSPVLGFLSFGSRSRETIQPGEAELLSTIADYLAVALNREKTDRELRAAQKKLNEHAQELEAKVADRTSALRLIIAEQQTFSYALAHDLRAPIRALIGYSEILQEEFHSQLPAEANQLIGRLHESSLRMNSLTRDMLEFSKISRQDIKLGTMDLEAIVSGVLSAMGPAAVAAATVLPPLHRVVGHRTLIERCVFNLVSNAMKFVPPGSDPRIRIWTEALSAPTRTNPKDTSIFTSPRFAPAEQNAPHSPAHARLFFEDEGIGIPAAAAQKVFGIFERGDNASEFEGTGIGLAIVARAMERMGGYCGVEANAERGSRFWLEFRMAEEPAGVESSAPKA